MLDSKDKVFKNVIVSAKSFLQCETYNSTMPLFVKSSQPDVNNQCLFTCHVVDDYMAMHPVTPENHRSTDGCYEDVVPLSHMATHSKHIFPTFPKSESCFAPPSIAFLPMMPSDEEGMMPPQRGLSFLHVVQECARPTSADDITATEDAKLDTNDNCLIGLLPRMLFTVGSDAKNERKSTVNQGLDKSARQDGDSWEKYFRIAKLFRQVHGHCCIPYKYSEDRKFVSFWERILSAVFVVRFLICQKGRLGQATAVPVHLVQTPAGEGLET
jgi:hypothetical protein